MRNVEYWRNRNIGDKWSAESENTGGMKTIVTPLRYTQDILEKININS